MKVVFPDTTLPEPTNGGFAFRKFVNGKQNGWWNSELHSQPSQECLADYKDDTIADAFPLLFPFGYTGLREDPAVLSLRGKNKTRSRTRQDVLRKYLQHRKPAFHSAMLNLVVDNLIMKDTISTKTRIYCNVKCSDNSTMGEKYGSVLARDLECAIQDNRNQLPFSTPVLQSTSF